MAQQKFQDSHLADEFSQHNFRFDDMERMQEIEQEMAKSESGKLSLAGLMAIAAAAGLIVAGGLNSLIGSGLLSFLEGTLMVIGSGAALYGLGKMVKMVTSKNLDLPALNVLRKTVTANVGQKTKQEAYNKNNLNQQANRGNYNPAQERTSNWKRSRRNRVFSGVAGGLAEYMGVSPALVRAFFVIALFTLPFTFFVYIILSMVLPKNYDDWRNRYSDK
ncbi:MAG: PspC domain-containing protein [Bacteroidia bacterium]